MAHVDASFMMQDDTYMKRNTELERRLQHELAHLGDENATATLMADARINSDYSLSGYTLHTSSDTPAVRVLGNCSELNTVVAGIHIRKPDRKKRNEMRAHIQATLDAVVKSEDFLDFSLHDSEALMHAERRRLLESRGDEAEVKAVNRFLVRTSTALGSGANTIRRPHLFLGNRRGDADEYVIYVRTYDVVCQAIMSQWLREHPDATLLASTSIMDLMLTVTLAKARILLFRVLAELARRVEGRDTIGTESVRSLYAPVRTMSLEGFDKTVPYAPETVRSASNCLWRDVTTGAIRFYNDCLCIPLSVGGLPVWAGTEHGYALFFTPSGDLRVTNTFGDDVDMKAPDVAYTSSSHAFPMETPSTQWRWPGSHADLAPSTDMEFLSPDAYGFMATVRKLVADPDRLYMTPLRTAAFYEVSGTNYTPSLIESYVEQTRDLDTIPPVKPVVAHRVYPAYPFEALMRRSNSIVCAGTDPYGRLSSDTFYRLVFDETRGRANVAIPGTTVAVVLENHHENIYAHADGTEPLSKELYHLTGRHGANTYMASPFPRGGSYNLHMADFAKKVVPT